MCCRMIIQPPKMCKSGILFPQGVQNDSQIMAETLNKHKDLLPNFRGCEKYVYLQSEINALFQKLENINGVSAGYLDR